MSKITYLIQEKSTVANDILNLTLIPKGGGNSFDFKPGQYAMLSFSDTSGKLFINHPFSIASSPIQRQHLQFGIKVMGNFTQALAKLPIGAEVEVMGPYGNFVFNENKHQTAVFIAGGIGITPFLSAIRYATDRRLNNPVTLFYSNRTLQGTSFHDEIKELRASNPKFKSILTITNEAIGENSDNIKNCRITSDLILENIAHTHGKDFFICGPAPFMKAMEDNLLSIGISRHNIHQEAFSMSPKLPLRENYKNIFAISALTAGLFLLFLNFVQPKTDKPLASAPIENAFLQTINDAATKRRNDIIAAKQAAVDALSTASNKQADIKKPVTVPGATSKPAPKTSAPSVTKPTITTKKPAVATAPTTKPATAPTPVVQQPTTLPPVVAPPVQTMPKPTTQVS